MYVFITAAITMVTFHVGGPLGQKLTPQPTKKQNIVMTDSPDVLVRIKGVEIVVPPLSKEEEQIGVTQTDMLSKVEITLRRNGVKVLTKENNKAITEHPWLLVKFAVYKDAFLLEMRFKENVVLLHTKDTFAVGATLWADGAIGYHGKDPEYVLKVIEQYAEKFALDYLKANPK